MASQYLWSQSRKAYYYISNNGHRRYVSKHDSAGPESPSQNTPPSSSSSWSDRRQNISGISATFERMNLDPDQSPFQVKELDFFKRGRVFATERRSSADDMSSGATVVSALDIPADEDTGRGFRGRGQIYVAITENAGGDNDHCHCLSVNTYGGRGVSKDDVVKADHGIIYSGKRRSRPPDPERDEEPRRGESGMCAVSLRVEMRLPSEKLDPMSRINYKTLSKFPKGNAVYHLGDLDKDSTTWLVLQCQAVQKRYNQLSKNDEEIDEDEDGDEDAEEADNSRRLAALAADAQGAKAAYRRMLSHGLSSEQAVVQLAQMLQRQKSIGSWEEAVASARGRLRYPPNAIPGV